MLSPPGNSVSNIFINMWKCLWRSSPPNPAQGLLLLPQWGLLFSPSLSSMRLIILWGGDWYPGLFPQWPHEDMDTFVCLLIIPSDACHRVLALKKTALLSFPFLISLGSLWAHELTLLAHGLGQSNLCPLQFGRIW